MITGWNLFELLVSFASSAAIIWAIRRAQAAQVWKEEGRCPKSSK